jgi:hypothetical protein
MKRPCVLGLRLEERSLLVLPLKSRDFDNGFDLFDESIEDISELGYVPSSGSLWMADGYEEGKLVVVLHIRIWRIDGKEQNFCATFYRSTQDMDLRRRADSTGDQTKWSEELKFTCCEMLHGYVEQPVLVRIVKVSNQAKEWRQALVRSIVRLQSLDYCLSRTVNGGRHPSSRPLVVKSFSGASDRKLEGIGIGRRASPAVSNRESINKVVECRSEVVDAIAADQRPTVDRRGLSDLNDHTVSAAVQIALLNDDIRVTLSPCDEFGIKSIEVFFGAAKLEIAGGELRSDHVID